MSYAGLTCWKVSQLGISRLNPWRNAEPHTQDAICVVPKKKKKQTSKILKENLSFSDGTAKFVCLLVYFHSLPHIVFFLWHFILFVKWTPQFWQDWTWEVTHFPLNRKLVSSPVIDAYRWLRAKRPILAMLLRTRRALKSTGRDRSWTGSRLRCMWMMPSCARRVIRARSLLAPGSWREYPAWTSLVSPLHTGVVSRHARATLMLYQICGISGSQSVIWQPLTSETYLVYQDNRWLCKSHFLDAPVWPQCPHRCHSFEHWVHLIIAY